MVREVEPGALVIDVVPELVEVLVLVEVLDSDVVTAFEVDPVPPLVLLVAPVERMMSSPAQAASRLAQASLTVIGARMRTALTTQGSRPFRLATSTRSAIAIRLSLSSPLGATVNHGERPHRRLALETAPPQGTASRRSYWGSSA